MPLDDHGTPVDDSWHTHRTGARSFAALERLGAHAPLGVVLLCYGLAIVLVNPLRETAFEDDWAYALTVRHLLDTGQFRMHDWSASNTPFQTYWGALFSHLLGYSFASLRISTLAAMLFGLIAFYFLAREHRLSSRQAAVLTLVFLVSPLAFKLSFTFMTDVPFLACVVAALYFYTHALRLGSYGSMFLGSAVASAAILTRQFGIAFVPGLLLVWLLAEERRRLVPLFLTGLLLPTLAAVAQAFVALRQPNWAGPWVAQFQAEYLRNVGSLLPQTAWRIAIILEYLALFCLPLVLVAIVDVAKRPTDPRSGTRARSRTFDVALTLALAAYLLAMNVYGTLVLHAGFLIPLMPWHLYIIRAWPLPLIEALTLLTVIGAVLFGRIITWRYVEVWRQLPLHERVVDSITLFLFAFQLFFFQFGDEYLLHLTPYTLIVVGRGLSRWLDRCHWLVGAISLCMLLLVTIWTRGELAIREAQWRAAEDLVAAGVPPDRIYSEAWEWNSYHGAFDSYVAQCNCAHKATAYLGYFSWFPTRLKTADYLVKQFPRAPRDPRLEVVAVVPFRDTLFRERNVYALRLRRDRDALPRGAGSGSSPRRRSH